MAKTKEKNHFVQPKHKHTTESIIFHTINYTGLILLAFIMLYPMLNTLAISLNDGMDALRGGIYLWPRMFSTRNYEIVFGMATLIRAFWITAARTVVGAITNLLFTSMLAYALSRKEYIFGKVIAVIFVMTLYFDAGLIPGFMLIRSLGLLNTFTVYWLPGLVGAFNLIVIRTFMRDISEELIESAKLDGAGHFRIYWQIIMPLCKPVLATIALFVAVGNWNAWFDAFIFNPARQDLSTLQFELQKLLAQAMQLGNSGANQAAGAASAAIGNAPTSPIALRAAITIVASVPILVVYPFLQRYFVTGLQLGGVKG